MIPFDEALKIVLETARRLPTELLPLSKLKGKVLAEAISTPFPLPRFDNTAVDGYAVHSAEYLTASAESPLPLTIRQTIRAGDTALEPMQHHQAIRIMTGAPIPSGADAVVMREDVESVEGFFIRRPVRPAENIRHKGEESSEGAIVLNSGTRVTPPVIGMLATLGLPSATVYRTPQVTLIITGDELRTPGEDLSSAQIYDSNGPALTSALNAAGIEIIRLRYATDQRDLLQETIRTSLADSDLIITVGGVSVGDYDFVRSVNTELGVRELFWRVAMKPGKPIYFGVAESPHNRTLVFGLPGNPVAALVTFILLVDPAIRVMMGDGNPAPTILPARMDVALTKKEGRLEFVRGHFYESSGVRKVIPVRGQESHMVSGLVAANCLIIFPSEKNLLELGSAVDIIPIEWSH